MIWKPLKKEFAKKYLEFGVFVGLSIKIWYFKVAKVIFIAILETKILKAVSI